MKNKTPWRSNKTLIFGGESGAHIYTTPNSGGNYYFSMRISQEKKYLRESLHTKDFESAISKAKDKFIAVRANLNEGKKIFGITLSELVAEYLEYRKDDIGLETGITLGRWRTIKTYLNSFLRYKNPTIKLSELNEDSAYEYLAFRNKEAPGISAVTIRNEQATINSMMKFAFRKRHINYEKFRFKEIKIREDKDALRRGVFNPDEYRSMYSFMRSWVSESRKLDDEKITLEKELVRDLILIAANTMLRVGELFNLKWGDIESLSKDTTDEGSKVTIVTINVRREISKVRKSRTVISRGGEYFIRLKKRASFTNSSDYVFTQIHQPKKFRKESFYDYWHEIMKGSKIKNYIERKITPYSLRHFGITTRLAAEIDIATLADIAGTSISQIEKHYGHINVAMKRRAILKDPKYVPAGVEIFDL